MKSHILFLTPLFLVGFYAHGASTCSTANLTRCLDSVCAINVSSNPAARCQYCGHTGAGTPPKTSMRSVTIGAAAKYSLTDKELKSAPTDPQARYLWAAKQCVAKVAGCTATDVTDTYNKLIEQSCTAAGISADMSKTLDSASKTKTLSECDAEIRSCVISDTYCMSDFKNCADNADFDKFFASCSVSATGCEEYLSEIRDDLIANRDTIHQNAEKILTQIVNAYKNAREEKIRKTKSDCADNSAIDNCIKSVCAQNMPNKCGDGYESEHSAASQLCAYINTACETLD